MMTAPKHPLSLTLSRKRERELGFTLVEMIVVIVITGIIGSVVAVFIKAPVQGYVDSARRAELTDIADTAFRRVGRDLRLALPNSVRVTTGTCPGGSGSCSFLEFIPTKGGGRYRAGPTGNELDFTSTTDNSFEVLGTSVNVASGDSIVIYNLGIAGADAYGGSSRRAAAAPFGAALTTVTFATGGTQFPFDSPGHRFHVVSTSASYVCDTTAGTLTRYSYAIQSAQPTSTLAGGNLLATHVGSVCAFTYDPLVSARNGLVTMRLSITQDSETVSLYSATHVSNQP